jgi:hypothetical protein
VSSRRIALVAALLAVVLAPTADAATRQIAPGQSFADAYAAAGAADVIVVGAGVYGTQTIPSAGKAVTFRGAAGNKVRRLVNHASNVTFDGIDVDANFTTPAGAAFESDGSNVTFANGSIGNVVDEKGALLGGWNSTASQHVVFDNVRFHDVYQDGDGIHNECLFTESPGLTVRNSTFTNCATMDMMIVRGDWWGQPSYGGITLVNNVFAHAVNGRDPRWHYYGLVLHGNMGQLTDARIVNNTFENWVGGITTVEVGSASGVWANNIGGGWDCLPGMTYAGNVGKKCAGSDVDVWPSGSCAPPSCSNPHTMAVGWLDPAHYDFRLTSPSPAIGAASAAYAPSTDRRGWARDGDPDAGAFEYGATAPPGTGWSTPPGATSWRLRSARLLKRTICRHARHGCPGSTKLRLGLGRPAAVTIRLDRLRTHKAPKRARVVRLRKVSLHRALRIRARGLRPGRYRLTIRATDATGLLAAPLRLRLRVR